MPSLAICRSFLKALTSLSKEEQRRTILFIDRFLFESRRLGTHLEPIEGAADRRMRSAKVDDNYRALMIQAEKDDLFYLVWVDSHDAAYEWARRNRYDDKELFDSASLAEAKPRPLLNGRLFKANSDRELLLLDIPPIFLPVIRNIETPEQLDELRHFMPTEIYEDLFYLSCGEKDHDIKARREKERKEFDEHEIQIWESKESAPKVTALNEPLVNGQIIRNKYIVDKFVGKDPEQNQSAIYKVFDLDDRIDSARAIKVFILQDARADEIINNELRVRQHVVHKNISRCFGVDSLEASGERFLILEYHEGHILSKWVQGRSMNQRFVKEMLGYTVQLLSGLKRLHEEGFVHGKISPEHIVIDNKNCLKIVSFDNSGPPGSDLAISWALERYSPPDKKVEGWHFALDTYAVGTILFEYFVGIFPDRKSPKMPNEVHKLLGNRLSDFVIRACQPNKVDRYTNAAEMLDNLRI